MVRSRAPIGGIDRQPQLLASEHFARPQHQAMEQFELAGGELDRTVVVTYIVSVDVHI